jgi:hypothetical protein
MKKIHLMLVVLFVFAVLTCTSGVASAYLSTEYVGNTMVDLSWTEYKSTDFSKYELYRDGSLIKTIRARTITFYRDTWLTKGHTYNYEIRSYYTTDKYGSDTTSATTGEVHGTITQDTTWTAANSPYTLTGDLLRIYDGATLTIAGGVQVSSNNIPRYWSDISVREKGTLNADGSRFCNVSISVYDSHADIKNCFLGFASIRLDNSKLRLRHRVSFEQQHNHR